MLTKPPVLWHGIMLGILTCLRVSCLTWGGQGDLVSRLLRGVSRVTTWDIGIINLLTKSP